MKPIDSLQITSMVFMIFIIAGIGFKKPNQKVNVLERIALFAVIFSWITSNVWFFTDIFAKWK
mgnify:CR=1 FL=1